MAEANCETEVYISGLGFLPGTTVEIFGWSQGNNTLNLVADPITIEPFGTFSTILDLARFTGCGVQPGDGVYIKRFSIVAALRAAR
jgi:hypothetical protein